MIFIALGANLPGPDGRAPLDTLRYAITYLNRLPHMHVIAQSRWYVTTPVPASDQPDYLNAVAVLRADAGADIDPAALLARLMAIEAACGRQRNEANAARTLDLDIIAIGDTIRAAPDPILPHLRAHLRRFVLAPLADVAPGWVHPVLGETITALLARLPGDGVTVLREPDAG
jgi:2-amino-4-hydroxy-6-hydroxymethyldihydropteridine diphosphokinase